MSPRLVLMPNEASCSILMSLELRAAVTCLVGMLFRLPSSLFLFGTFFLLFCLILGCFFCNFLGF